MNNDFIENIPESVLERLQSIELEVPSANAHQAMDELLKRSVLLGGKRLRPLLTYLFGHFFEVSLKKVDVCSRSIEMVHAASLAHDDVIDAATTRRDLPSINIQGSNKKAVLAGDYLLAAVIGELCRSGRLELVSEMAHVIELLSQGEWLQADLIESKAYTRELIEDIAYKKTASVMSWCAVSPGLIKGLGKEQISYARQFGYHLGIAFQLIDDTLDFSGDSKKDSLLDLKNGQINSVLYEWLDLHPDVFSAFKEGHDIFEKFNEDKLDVALERVQKRAKDHLNKCRELIKVLSNEVGQTDSTKISPLEFIVDFLENRHY